MEYRTCNFQLEVKQLSYMYKHRTILNTYNATWIYQTVNIVEPIRPL